MAAPMNASLVKRLTLCTNKVKLLNRRCKTSTSANIKEAKDFSGNKKSSIFVKPEEKTEFRTFELDRKRDVFKRRARRVFYRPPVVPRYRKMKADQDWTAVWPTAQMFKWSVVPFPVRQGYIKVASEGPGDGSPPAKYANAELMKIPNFLHLTPGHITKHCAAIKKFCTPWPEGLETDEDCQKHFPLEVISSDYCFASPNIRDTRARVVTLKFNLSDLGLDYHGRDKFKRLVGSRYNKDTDEVTITSDRCPMKKQNYDYIQYLITVLFFESAKVEPWEESKTFEDMEKYFWDLSPSRKNVLPLLQKIQDIDKASTNIEEEKTLPYLPEELDESSVVNLEPVQQYKESVEKLINTGENNETVSDYRKSVMKLLNIKTSLNV